jgi:AcrR family transcriptional regulator
MPSLNQPKQGRSRRTLDRLVAAGLSLLEEGGPDAVTVKAVVARARSSVGSFYARFEGKDDLLAYLREQVRQSAEAEWSETVGREAWEASLAGIAAQAVALLFDLRPGYEQRIRTADRLVTDGEDDELRRKALDQLAARFLERREEITHPNPELAVRIALSAVLGIGEHAPPWGQVETDALRTECVQLLLGYLSGRPHEDAGPVEFFDVWG